MTTDFYADFIYSVVDSIFFLGGGEGERAAVSIIDVFDTDLQSFWESISARRFQRVRSMTGSRRIRRRTCFAADEESPSFSTPGMDAVNATHVRWSLDPEGPCSGISTTLPGGKVPGKNFDNPTGGKNEVPGKNCETRDIETRRALWITQPQKRCVT